MPINVRYQDLVEMLRDMAIEQLCFASGPIPSECDVEFDADGNHIRIKLLHPDTQEVLAVKTRSVKPRPPAKAGM